MEWEWAASALLHLLERKPATEEGASSSSSSSSGGSGGGGGGGGGDVSSGLKKNDVGKVPYNPTDLNLPLLRQSAINTNTKHPQHVDKVLGGLCQRLQNKPLALDVLSALAGSRSDNLVSHISFGRLRRTSRAFGYWAVKPYFLARLPNQLSHRDGSKEAFNRYRARLNPALERARRACLVALRGGASGAGKGWGAHDLIATIMAVGDMKDRHAKVHLCARCTHTMCFLSLSLHTHTHTHTHSHTHTHTHTHTHIHTYIHTHTHKHTYIHIYMHIHIHIYTYIYIYTYTYTYTYTTHNT
jgi:hypothetical protein